MIVEPQEIELFQDDNGDIPFEIWLYSLKDIKARAIVRTRLARVRLGNFGDHKPISDGIFELRIDFGPGYRIYYAKQKAKIVLLLVGGDKKSQPKDIKRAIEYWREFRSKENG